MGAGIVQKVIDTEMQIKCTIGGYMAKTERFQLESSAGIGVF